MNEQVINCEAKKESFQGLGDRWVSPPLGPHDTWEIGTGRVAKALKKQHLPAPNKKQGNWALEMGQLYHRTLVLSFWKFMCSLINK